MSGLFDDLAPEEGSQPQTKKGPKGLFDDLPQSTERTWTEAASDVGTGLVTGAVNLGRSVSQLSPAALAAEAQKRVLGTVGIEAPGSEAVNRPAGRQFEQTGDILQGAKSPGLKETERQVASRAETTGKEAQQATAERLGETGSRWAGVAAEAASRFKNTFTNPALMAQTLAENAPSVLPAGAGGRVAQEATGLLLSRRLTQEAVERAARTAGVAGGVAVGAAQQGNDVANETFQRMMAMDEATWSRDENYRLLKRDIGARAAKEQIAGTAATEAGVKGGLASLAVNAVGAKMGGAAIESALLKGEGKRLAERGAAKEVAKSFVGEAVTEGIEEGSGQLAQNLAVQGVDATQDALAGVGSAAGAGAAAGAAMGGGLSGMAALSRQRDDATARLGEAKTVDEMIGAAADLSGDLGEMTAVMAQAEQAVDAYLGTPPAAQENGPATVAGEAGPETAPVAAVGGEPIVAPPATAGIGANPALPAPTIAAGALPQVQRNIDQSVAATTVLDQQLAQEQAATTREQSGAPAAEATVELRDGIAQAEVRRALGAARAQEELAGGNPALIVASPSATQPGTFQLRRLPLPDAAPAPRRAAAPGLDQQRIEQAAVEGDFRAAKPDLQSQLTQQGFRRAQQAVEQRGGVATREEAALLDQASPNERLYDSIQGEPTAAAPAPSPSPVDEARTQLRAQRAGIEVPQSLRTRREAPAPAAPESRVQIERAPNAKADAGQRQQLERADETPAPAPARPSPFADQRLEAAAAEGRNAPQPGELPIVERTSAFVNVARRANTPAGRMFAQQYDEGRITDADIETALTARDEIASRMADAAAQAPGQPAGVVPARELRARGVSPTLAEAMQRFGNLPRTPVQEALDRAREQRANPKPKAPSAVAPPAADDVGARLEAASEGGKRYQRSNSWVIRNKETGQAVMETTDQRKVDALNTAKYEAVPAGQHLAELNDPDSKAGKAMRGIVQVGDIRRSTSRDGDTLQAQVDGKPVSVKLADNRALGTHGLLIRQIARVFGKRVQAFSDPEGALGADGFVGGDRDTIYLNTESQMSPLAVFGHELAHLIERDSPAVYRTIKAAVAKSMTTEARRAVREDNPSADLDEVTSDMVGNALADPEFWPGLFRDLGAAKVPLATVQDMAAKVTDALTKVLRLVRQPGFKADKIVGDQLVAIREAIRVGVRQYAEGRYEAAQQLDRETQADRYARDEGGRFAKPEEAVKPSAPPTPTRAERQAAAGADARREMGLRFSSARDTLAAVQAAWDEVGIEHDITERNGVIQLKNIEVPFSDRKAGIGTEAMRTLTEYADRSGQTIKLGASSQLGGDKARLIDFYKRFGFATDPRTAPASSKWKDTTMTRAPQRDARRSAIRNNASGESAASLEAQSRIADEKARGLDRVLVERDGTVRPLYGVDSVDQRVRAGQTILQHGVGREPWSVLDKADDVKAGQVERAKAAAAKWREERAAETPAEIPTGEATEISLDDLGDLQFSARRAAPDSPAFKAWFRDSKVVDEDGDPLRVYHGALTDFDTFDPSRANVESDLGAGFYFSNTPEDVERNYATGDGADITAKIEQLADRLENDEDMDRDEAKQRARETFAQNLGTTMPVYLSIQNPVTLDGKKSTFLDYASEYNEDLDEYGEPGGKLQEFFDGLHDVAMSDAFSDLDVAQVIADVQERAFDDEGIRADQLIDIAKRSEGLQQAIDNNDGKLASTEIIRRAFEAAGFDGFIDRTVYDKFGEGNKTRGATFKGMNRNTTHFIAFHPEQVKSATGNNGAFDPSDANITRSARRNNFGTLTAGQEAALNNVGGIAVEQTLRERFRELRTGFGKRAIQGALDQFAPIKDLDQNAYMLARLSKGYDGTLESALLYGKPFLRGGVPDVDVNDTGFAKVLADLQGEGDRFLWWVAAQRADRLKALGLENLFSDADIAELKTLTDGTMPDGTTKRSTAYAKALGEFNAFNDAVLAVAEESGLIDAKAREMYRGVPYVPFYRVLEDEGVQGPTFSSGLTNAKAWKKLKGGSQKLNNDLLANVLLNWSSLYQSSARNRAALATMKAAVGVGIAEQVASGTKKSVQIMNGGRTEHYLVDDPHLAEAISAMEYVVPKFLKPLSTVKRWLTMGVTANPAYKIRNLMRDTISAMGQADLSFNPIRNVAEGLAASDKRSQTYASMLASGGTIRFGVAMEGADATGARRLVAKAGMPAVVDQKNWKKVAGMLGDLWEAYQEVGDKFENVNRAALYKQLIANGKTHAEAAFMARDLLDFSMQGRWPVIRFLASTVPFLNSRLQGLYKLARAGKQNPKRMAYVTGAVMLASIGLMLAYKDDEDWKKRSDEDRDSSWWFKIGDTAIRIPKPFELGAIGTMAERAVEMLASDEMTAKRFGQSLSRAIFQTFAFDPTPQLAKPMLDVYANRDSFSGRQIESMADQRMRPEDRYDERTTMPARILGQLGLPDPAQLAKGKYAALSPKQIDFLARGYFGWAGATTMSALDYGIRPFTDRGERPDIKLRDAFLAGSFVESLPSNSSRYVNALYEEAKAADQVYASFQDARKDGDLDKAREILDENRATLAVRKGLDKATKALTEINKQIKQVESSKSLSGETKRKMIDRLSQQRSELAEAAVRRTREAREKAEATK